jgi:DNA-binding HxlR family transcriptional regulator
MEPDRLYMVSEMMKVLPSCAELSNQKLSALLRQMVTEGTIVRTEDKRKAYFSLAK